MRRLALLLAVLAIAAAAALLLLDGETADPAREAQPAAAGGAAEPAGARGGATEPATVAQGNVGVERTAAAPAAGDPRAALLAGPLLWVEVVRQQGGAAVPGAQVLLLAPEETQAEEMMMAFFTGVPLEDVFRRFGSQHLADARGRAALPLPAEAALIAALADDSFGLLQWEPGETAPGLPVRIEVVPDPPLRILVRDADGRPVADVPVAARVGEGDFFSFDLARARTGADGIGELRRVRAILPVFTGGGGVECRAAIAAVLAEPVGQIVNLDALGADPVELSLPPTGSVRVRLLDESGRPYRAAQMVALAKARENPEDDDDWLAPGMPAFDAESGVAQDGELIFPYVGLGLQLQAAAQFPGAPHASQGRAAGPQRAGERVEIELRHVLDYPVLTARLLDPAGAPLAGRAVEARLLRRSDEGEWDEQHDAVADTEGRVRFGVTADAPGEALTVEWSVGLAEGGTAAALAGASPVPILRPGEVDLGEVRLAPAQVLAAGRVLGPTGLPVPGATVVPRVREESPDPSGDADWSDVWRLQVETDAAGRFTIHGGWSGGPLGLRVTAAGHLPALTVADPGARDLEIRLVAAGGVEGRILADPGVDLGQLTVRLRPQGAPADEDRTHRTSPHGETGAFQFHQLEEGLFDLSVMFDGQNGRLMVADESDAQEEPLLRVDGVLVGGPPDLRLQSLDLRGRLHGCRIQARGEGGVELQMLQAWRAAAPAAVFHGWNGQVGVLAREPLGELVICAPGWRETRFTPLGPAAEVTLLRGIQILIEVPSAAVRPAGRRLGCFLMPTDGGASWVRGARATFDDAGIATLLLTSPGGYRVEFVVAVAAAPADDMTWWGFQWVQRGEGEEPAQIEVAEAGAQKFRLAPPPEAQVLAVAESMAAESAAQTED